MWSPLSRAGDPSHGKEHHSLPKPVLRKNSRDYSHDLPEDFDGRFFSQKMWVKPPSPKPRNTYGNRLSNENLEERASTTFPFLELPLELRRMVYRYYIGSEPILPRRLPGSYGKHLHSSDVHRARRDLAIMNVHAILFVNQQIRSETVEMLANTPFVIEVSPFHIAFLYQDTTTDSFELQLPTQLILDKIRNLQIRLQWHWPGEVSQPHARPIRAHSAHSTCACGSLYGGRHEYGKMIHNLSTVYATLIRFRALQSLDILNQRYEPVLHISNADYTRYTETHLLYIASSFDRLARQVMMNSLRELPFNKVYLPSEDEAGEGGWTIHEAFRHSASDNQTRAAEKMGCWYVTAVEMGVHAQRSAL